MTPTASSDRDRASGVTWRAAVLAIAILLLTLPLAFLSEIVYGKGQWGTSSFAPPPWPMAVLVLLAALMGLPVFRRAGLTRRELLAIYAIVIAGAPLMSRTVLFYIVPKGIVYYHMMRQNPQWETAFIQYLPSWFAPSSMSAVEGFFLGGVPVPWGEWLLPLAVWASVALALYGACFGLLVIIGGQWINNERLAFPLAQIPLETVKSPDGEDRPGRLPRATWFWVGLAGGIALTSYSVLSTQVPALPAIPTSPVKIIEWQGVGPLAGLGSFYVNFSPALIGIIYLLPKEISFSCWFFWVLRLAVHVLAITAGVQPQKPESWGNDFPAPYQTGAGATIAFGLWALWTARRHLFRVLRIAFSRRTPASSTHDPLLYRAALVGFAVCFAWLLTFCLLMGSRLLFAFALMATIVGTFLVWARVRADTALEPCVSEGYSWLLAPIGSRGLRPQEIVTMISMRWATFPVGSAIFSACVMNSLQALKLGDATNANQRRLVGTVTLGFAVSLLAGMVLLVAGIYHFGYFGTHSGAAPYWPSLYNRLDGGVIADLIDTPSEPDRKSLIAMGAGGVISILLGILRVRYWWWPLHPVGFIVAMGWGLIDNLVPFFIGWAGKALVIRYGGLKLYRATLPLVVGLIAGGLTGTALWSVLAVVTRGYLGPPNY